MSSSTDNQHAEGVLTVESTVEFSGIQAEILMGLRSTARTIMKLSVELGRGAPAHISKDEDKLFVVVEGAILFLIGEQKRHVAAGDVVFVPEGVVHSFSGLERAGSSMVLVSTPARHHEFFQRMGALALPHDQAEVRRICEELGQEIVGPVVSE